MSKKFLFSGLGIFLVLFSLWQQTVAYAQALPVAPVANFVVNRAVGGIITRVAAARGFAANDPRILTTMNAAGAQLSVVNTAATVAGVGFAIAGAPVWLGIAASFGVLAVGAAIVAGNTTISMDAGKITVAQPLPAGPAYAPVATTSTDGWSLAAAEGVPIYRTSTCLSNDTWCSSFPTKPTTTANFTYSAGTVVLMAATLSQIDRLITLTQPVNYPQFGETIAYNHYWVPNADGTDHTLFRRASGMEYVYDSGTGSYMLKPFDRSYAATYVSPGTGVKPLSSTSLNTIYPSIGASAAAEPVPDATLAKLVDQAWKNAAAQPGYEGLPYSMTNPVTASEVQPWISANPQAAPKISDLLKPASNPNTQVVPISPTVTVDSSTSPTPTPTPTGTLTDVNVVNTPNVNVTNQISVDLGPNPGTVSPSLDSPNWLQPLLDMLPGWRTASFTAQGECLTPTVDLNPFINKSITMSSHCDLFESQRQTLSVIMSFVWVAVAAFIVLRA